MWYLWAGTGSGHRLLYKTAHSGTVRQNGAGWLNHCRHLWLFNTDAVEAMFRMFHEWFPRLRLEFHGHSDNGCGAANCLAAMWGGAQVIHTALNGMGERCGNVATEGDRCSL